LRHIDKPLKRCSTHRPTTVLDNSPKTALDGHQKYQSALAHYQTAQQELTVLSFRTLQRTYQISPSTAKRIRQALIRDGLMDAATHQLTLI